MRMKKLITLVSVMLLTSFVQAEDKPEVKAAKGAEYGELLFSDDFERKDLGEKWIEHFATATIKDGKLNLHQKPDKHPAIARHEMELTNAIFEFDLYLPKDAVRALLVVNGEEHIFHASFANHPKGLKVSLKDYVKKKLVFSDTVLEASDVYKVKVVLIADELEVIVNGKSLVTLKSPGIAAKKSLFQLNAVGQEIKYDNVKVWAVKHSK